MKISIGELSKLYHEQWTHGFEIGKSYNAKGNIVDDASICELNGHTFVDLGLPSGTLWATCNVGATTPEEDGDCFAWGETEPKDEYTKGNYKYQDEIDILPASADAATVNWGEGWRMPTPKEFLELGWCEWTWMGKGYKLTGPNGNSIYLPGKRGVYWSCWSSSPIGNLYAQLFHFYSENTEKDCCSPRIDTDSTCRDLCYPIRPVCLIKK